MKKTVGCLALIAALFLCVSSALAQNYKGTPKPTIQDYGPFNNVKGHNTDVRAAAGQCGNPAAHCLFYGGDFLYDPLSSNVANGLANEDTSFISGTPYGAAVWVPFVVPNGQTWAVTGMFSNNQSSYGVLDQSPNQPEQAAYWAIQEGILPGYAGTTVASGVGAATSTPTGRAAFNLGEYTIEVQGLSVTLTSGTYWMAVVPMCTNTLDPYCSGVFFLSDVEYINSHPKNAVGDEPVDSSYFDSAFFGLSYDPPNGQAGACFALGCDAFSAGIQGHVVTP